MSEATGTQGIVEQIEKLSAPELAELVHALEQKWGVSATAPAAGGAAAGAGGGGAAEAAEEFQVLLKSAGAQKIGVIKVVREITGLGLKEAKDLVDGAPKPVKTGLPKAQAEELLKKLQAAGAEAELKPA